MLNKLKSKMEKKPKEAKQPKSKKEVKPLNKKILIPLGVLLIFLIVGGLFVTKLGAKDKIKTSPISEQVEEQSEPIEAVEPVLPTQDIALNPVLTYSLDGELWLYDASGMVDSVDLKMVDINNINKVIVEDQLPILNNSLLDLEDELSDDLIVESSVIENDGVDNSETIKNPNNKIEYIYHKVRQGETISSIARLYYGRISYKNEIMKINGIREDEILSVGTTLKLIKK